MPAFNPARPQLRYQLTFEGAWPTAVAFAGSGRRVVAGNQDGHIYLWNLPDTPPPLDKKAQRDRMAPNAFPIRRLEGHDNGITRLLVTPGGKHLVSASLDHTVRIWPLDAPAAGKVEVILDAETRKNEARRVGKKEPNPAPGIVVETQTACRVLEGHRDWVQALGLSGDGSRLISGDAVSQIIVWDLPAHKPVARWSGFPWSWIVAASLSQDGKTALVSEHRYKRDDFDIPAPALKLWNVADQTVKLDLLKVQFPKYDPAVHTYGGAQVWNRFVAGGLIATAFSPDGKLLALAQGGETDTGKIHLLDAGTGKLVRDVSGHFNGATDVLFSADGKHVISAGRDTCARVCQVADGKEVAVLGSPRGGQSKDWLSALALSPDQRSLAAADIAGLVHVWDFAG
jgi:WD40 repeat protein